MYIRLTFPCHPSTFGPGDKHGDPAAARGVEAPSMKQDQSATGELQKPIVSLSMAWGQTSQKQLRGLCLHLHRDDSLALHLQPGPSPRSTAADGGGWGQNARPNQEAQQPQWRFLHSTAPSRHPHARGRPLHALWNATEGDALKAVVNP
eukprot:scaffold127483_cov17-Tisochrysis_lutea.AAC.1